MFFVGVHASREHGKSKEKWAYKEEAMMIIKKKIAKETKIETNILDKQEVEIADTEWTNLWSWE